MVDVSYRARVKNNPRRFFCLRVLCPAPFAGKAHLASDSPLIFGMIGVPVLDPPLYFFARYVRLRLVFLRFPPTALFLSLNRAL